MTDLFEQEWRESRPFGANLIAQELRQFKRLQHLSDYDVAFRMASSLDEVRKLRKLYRQDKVPLYNTKIVYAVRVILGQRGVKNTGQLFALSDRDLLAFPSIGHKRLEDIRQALKDYFG